MTWIIIIVAILFIAFLCIGAYAEKEQKQTKAKELKSADIYYYDTYIKTISLYARKGYKKYPLVGIGYRDLPLSAIGKFEGYAWAEDDNEHDKYAISIYGNDKGHVGYIPRGNYDLHERLMSDHRMGDAYGYIAYSESDGFYGAVCVEYNDDLDDNF